jgi:hypothetical protein
MSLNNPAPESGFFPPTLPIDLSPRFDSDGFVWLCRIGTGVDKLGRPIDFIYTNNFSTQGKRMNKKFAVSIVAASILLSACGGGGGGDKNSLAAPTPADL